MTNENYTQMSDQDLVDTIYGLKYSKQHLSRMLQKYHESLYIELIERTKFLNDGFYSGTSAPIKARIYCLLNGIITHPKCQNPNCDNLVEWRKSEFRFAPHCCEQCRNSDEGYWQKIKDTNLKKYGVECTLQSKEVREKSKQTCLKHYGVEYSMQSQQVREKSRQTCIEKYGVEFSWQAGEVKDKIKQTWIDKYGVDHPAKTKDFQSKRQNTCKLKYGVENYVESEEFKQKSKQTSLHNYGVDSPSKSKVIQDKIKQRNLEKYGVEYSWQADEVKQKAQHTCIERYGVDNYAKSLQYHTTKKHKFESSKYPGNWFDSTWEIQVFEYCKDNDIQMEYQPPISFEYEYAGVSHTYHPDFRINGCLFEVKGDHFFRINESTNIEEMYCPYRNPNWSDGEYEDMCGLYEAKHQCMLKNGVKILRSSQIVDLRIDMFQV